MAYLTSGHSHTTKRRRRWKIRIFPLLMTLITLVVGSYLLRLAWVSLNIIVISVEKVETDYLAKNGSSKTALTNATEARNKFINGNDRFMAWFVAVGEFDTKGDIQRLIAAAIIIGAFILCCVYWYHRLKPKQLRLEQEPPYYTGFPKY